MTDSPETRNLVDFYHYWKNEDIRAHLNRKRHPFAVLCCNIARDFNIGTILRNCNAFLGKKFIVYGRRKFDRRGTVGTHHYENITHCPTLEEAEAETQNYVWVGIDNVEGAVSINDFEWPENTLMCFGEEQVGLAPEILERCKHVVYIPQYGTVRSLNVGTAAGIAMYDWADKYHKA